MCARLREIRASEAPDGHRNVATSFLNALWPTFLVSYGILNSLPMEINSRFLRSLQMAPGIVMCRCALVAVLLCGPSVTASAQTAHYTGAGPTSWIQSTITSIPSTIPAESR